MEVKKANSGWLAFLVSGIVAIGYGVLAILLTEKFVDILEIVMRVSGICIAATGAIFLIAAIGVAADINHTINPLRQNAPPATQ